MPSKKRSEGVCPTSRHEVRSIAQQAVAASLKQWFEETLGKLSRKSDHRHGGFVTHWDGGKRCCASLMTAASKSIIMQPNERCGS